MRQHCMPYLEVLLGKEEISSHPTSKGAILKNEREMKILSDKKELSGSVKKLTVSNRKAKVSWSTTH